MRGKPTMIDVADEGGISLGTVSKVLRGDPTVSSKLRERVLAACRSLNYQRNWIAASLRNRQTDTVGIIIPDILNTFYATLVEKLENLASVGGYTVVIVTTGEEPQRALQRINVVKDRLVDGVIVIPALGSSETLASSVGADLSCVIVDRVAADNPFPSVATENFDAAYQGARYLLSLGHRHIAIAANSPRLWNTRERIAGFERAMAEGNGRADVRIVGMTVEEARISLEGLLGERERPTALFTSNNLVTLGAVGALRSCGVSVPHEISLLAFDDFEWLRLLRPAISAINQPADQIAVEAWRLLSHQMSGRPVSNPHVRAAGQLVIRESTAQHGRIGKRAGARE